MRNDPKTITTTLYVKIYTDKFSVKNISDNGRWLSACSDIEFTTEKASNRRIFNRRVPLRKLVKDAIPKGFFTKRPMIVSQPIEKVGAGLSEVEERIFKELAIGAGAIKVVLHVGNELTDNEVTILINSVK